MVQFHDRLAIVGYGRVDHNRVAGSFSPPAPTPLCMLVSFNRLRTSSQGRFTELSVWSGSNLDIVQKRIFGLKKKRRKKLMMGGIGAEIAWRRTISVKNSICCKYRSKMIKGWNRGVYLNSCAISARTPLLLVLYAICEFVSNGNHPKKRFMAWTVGVLGKLGGWIFSSLWLHSL